MLLNFDVAGTGEFLDAWLMLLEKMVNPKNIFESPHQLPNKTLQGSKAPFSPLQYLISTHRQAFDAVMKLWGKRPLKVYGARMTESVLTILCHILKGTDFIQQVAVRRFKLFCLSQAKS